MSNLKTILIVENQQRQFDKIKLHIGNSNKSLCNILPGDDYLRFIDSVRIWVNDRYVEEYRKQAFEFINSLVVKCDIILMDHRLGGSFNCKTGIDLARKINAGRTEGNHVPVVFLSKTEHTDEDRLKDYALYQENFPNTSVWVHKGFFGDEIMKPDYVEEYVIKEIVKLLDKKDMYFEGLKQHIKMLLHQQEQINEPSSDLIDDLNALLNTGLSRYDTIERLNKLTIFHTLKPYVYTKK